MLTLCQKCFFPPYAKWHRETYMWHYIEAGIDARGELAWTNMAEQVAVSHHCFPAPLCMWRAEHNDGIGGKPCTGKPWQLDTVDMSGYTWLYSGLVHISRYCLNSALLTMDLYTLYYLFLTPSLFVTDYWTLYSTLTLTPLLCVANLMTPSLCVRYYWPLYNFWPLYSLNQNAYSFDWLNLASKARIQSSQPAGPNLQPASQGRTQPSQTGQDSTQPAKLAFNPLKGSHE